ncbi:MAG: hypothetical protein KBC56_04785 [Flavobacterium sp.]|nr:hypothetical protein [Flavobacterium sp.]
MTPEEEEAKRRRGGKPKQLKVANIPCPEFDARRKAIVDQRLAEEEKKRIAFMKVKEGETPANWAFRVRKYRPMTHKEIEGMTGNSDDKNKLRGKLNRIKRSKEKYEKKRRRVASVEIQHNYLKYYIHVRSWACVKFGIRPTDLEIGLHFYENKPFKRDEFSRIFQGVIRTNGAFKRFYQLGYIKKVMAKTLNTSGPVRNKKKVSTYEYMLTTEFKNKIEAFYKLLEGEDFNVLYTSNKTLIPEKTEMALMKLRQEMDEITRGQKQADTVAYRNNFENEEL